MPEINLKKLRFEENLSQEELGKILGVTKQQVGRIENGHSKLSEDKRLILLSKFPKLQNNISFTGSYKPLSDIIQIPYWSGLPDELKHPEYTSVMAQRISIEHGWELKPENLCIVAMNGDAMENYWYKIRNNDVLIIDTSETKINANGSGVYFATSRNNSMFWIREMQMLYNGDIEIHSYSPSGAKTKVLTQEQLKDADFRVIGKVIKNVSFRL